MTHMQKAIMQAIKEHNAERDGLAEYNNKIKFVSMGKYDGSIKQAAYGDTCHYEYSEDYNVQTKIDDVFMRLTVKCAFKPADKNDANIVIYEVMMYSNGAIGIYFDGTEYSA